MKRPISAARLYSRLRRTAALHGRSKQQIIHTARSEAEKKADSFDAIQKSVEDAATVGAGIWLSYLFVLFYLAVAAAAVTHADLLLENPVKLPFLNIELPLTFFFLLSPVLFVVVHAYTLVHFVFLSRKTARFHDALHVLFPDRSDSTAHDQSDRNSSIREALRRQLPSNVFVQILAGPNDIRKKSFGRLLRLITLFTLVLGPIGTLLLFQISFLPYHGSFVTWLHRCAIILDAGLILWLWPSIVGHRDSERRKFRATARPGFGIIVLTLLAVTFSFTTATFPGEKLERVLPNVAFVPTKWTSPSIQVFTAMTPFLDWTTSLDLKSPHELLFSGAVDPTSRRRSSLFSNTLVLPDFDIYNALKVDEPSKIQWKDTILSLRGRHLEGAVLDNARLYKVDLTGSHMENASLVGTNLAGAVLTDVNLQGAMLSAAHLEGANMSSAQLDGATLVQTSLEGTSLENASLLGAALLESHLQGANLRYAQLQGVVTQIDPSDPIVGPDFSGALLGEANLQGASLVNSNFTGAELAQARVWRTDFDGSKSPSANCEGMNFRPSVPSTNDNQDILWDESAYQNFLGDLSKKITFDETKERVLHSLDILSCERPDLQVPELSCASGGKIPPKIEEMQRDFKKHCKTDIAHYRTAAMNELKQVICNGKEEAIYVLRGLLGSPIVAGEMFDKPSKEAADLMIYVASKKCAVNPFLTDRDRSDIEFIISRANAPE